MKDERKKIKEPFEPDDTPRPPQQVDPGTERKSENPAEGKSRKAGDPANKDSENSEKSHLLDENAEIDDETTI